MKKRSVPFNLIHLLLFVFIIYFCTTPVISVILYGFQGKGEAVTAAQLSGALDLLWNSLGLALGVSFVAVVLGTIVTFTLHRIRFGGRGALRILILLPLVNPAFVSSIAFIMLFGKRGLITHQLLGLNSSPFGWHGVFILQLMGSVTLAYLIIASSVQNIDTAIEDAATNLGASPFTVLTRVTLPMMYPELTTAFLMVFLSSMADFTTPMIIGGRFTTLATSIYLKVSGGFDMKMASISGILLLIPCLIAFLIQRFYSQKRKYSNDQASQQVEYANPPPWLKRLLITVSGLIIGFFMLNFAFIVVGAFTENWGYNYTFTTKHVQQAFATDFARYAKPFVNTITLSVVTGVASSAMGIWIAYLVYRKKIRFSKWLDFLAMFPAAVPGILLGVGYLVTFKYPFFGIGGVLLPGLKPVILLGTTFIVYMVCIFRNINVSMKSCYALLEHVDEDMEQASYNLGASKFQTLRWVILPMLKDAFANAYIKIFANTMTTLGVIIFLLMPKNKVIVQILFQSLTGVMAFGVPAVLALSLSLLTLVLMLLFLVLFYGMDRLREMRRLRK